MIRNFRDLMGNIFGSEKDPEGPDLFEYASKESGDSSTDFLNKKISDNDIKSRRSKKILAASMAGLYPVFFAAGYMYHKTASSCDDLQAALGMIPGIGVSEDVEIVPALPAEAARYLGRYGAEISGHKAFLYIYAMKSGGLGGSIRFTEWGKREMEYLKAVRISNNRLSFIRSCKGAECVRIGSPSTIYQAYSGELNPAGDTIEGQYTGGQSSSNWKASRIR